MRPSIPDFKKGERLSHEKLQAMLDAIRTLFKISVTAPLELFWGSTGPTIALKRQSKDPGNKFGIVYTSINACSLTPGLVNQYRLDFNPDGTVRARVPILKSDGTPERFKALDAHGTTIPPGRWVSCLWDEKDIWEVIAAHCTGSCVSGGNNPPPPPPGGCSGTPPNCPPGTSACCQNGVWNCCPDSPPPPPDCCPNPAPACPEGYVANCINCVWTCEPAPPQTCVTSFDCTANTFCLPGGTPCCINGFCTCCYGDTGPPQTGGGGTGGGAAPLP